MPKTDSSMYPAGSGIVPSVVRGCTREYLLSGVAVATTTLTIAITRYSMTRAWCVFSSALRRGRQEKNERYDIRHASQRRQYRQLVRRLLSGFAKATVVVLFGDSWAKSQRSFDCSFSTTCWKPTEQLSSDDVPGPQVSCYGKKLARREAHTLETKRNRSWTS
jgi:hypothetical protein